MSKIATITAKLSESGTLPKAQSDYLRSVLQGNAGRDVQITIADPQRSLSQNAFLWGSVYPPIQRALAAAGHCVSAEALHAHYKARYLPQTVETVFGHEVVCEPRSSKLGRGEFASFVEAILSDPETLEAMAMANEFAPNVDQYERRHGTKVG